MFRAELHIRGKSMAYIVQALHRAAEEAEKGHTSYSATGNGGSHDLYIYEGEKPKTPGFFGLLWAFLKMAWDQRFKKQDRSE